MRTLSLSLTLALMLTATAAFASGNVKHPKQENWSFDGVTGTFDKPAIQRGLQVYKEVCATCHSLNRIAFRTLDGVGFSEAEVKSLAAQYMVVDGPNDDGEMFERAGRASDKFPSPYANEQAARAINNGAYPVDLSLIVKARPDGANYVYSLLTGYADAPAYRCEEVDKEGACVKFEKLDAEEAKAEADAQAEAAKALAEKKDDMAATEEEPVVESKLGKVFYCASIAHADGAETCAEMGSGMHYNPYFPGGQIAMPSPLHTADLVTYQDETKATPEQMAHDVVNFLQWAAEPEMEVRKRMGIRVILFLVAFTGFFYVAKKRIWARIH